MRTIINLFESSVKKYSDNIFLWQHDSKQYVGTSYYETGKRVHAMAAGLMKLGLKHGDRVTLLSEGRNDWVIGELSILFNGAINVPLSVRLSEPEELKFRLEHSGSGYAIASGRHIGKILDVADSVPSLKKIISLDPVEENNHSVLFIEDIVKEGEALLKTDEKAFRKRYNSVAEDDIANICYTSGTTADPKGIILTHRNYTANVEQLSTLYNIPEWYTTLLILPWDHSFAHTCGLYAKMKYGASLASVQVGSTPMETLKNIPKNIREIKPVFLLSVPALAKNFRKNIEKAIQDKGGFAEKLFYHALGIAYKYNGDGWKKGKGFSFLLWPLLKLYDAVLFKKVRAGFGGRLKFFVGGGALLDIELQRFFMAIGIPMFQGYGLTEASPVISSNTLQKVKMGSSGVLVSGLELKICDEDGNSLPAGVKGEIVVKGENVMKGYWKNETATKETLRNGWLHTGDLGYLDEDGFLYVLGRFKSLLIADDGEKFSPEGIEEAFSDNSNLIEQCMLYNNQKPYSVCLLVPNKEALNGYIRENNIPEEGKYEKALLKLNNELNRYRKGGAFESMFPQRWLPVAVGILSEGFTEENRMINSTMKMVRPRITEQYKDLLDYLYSPDAKSITNKRNVIAMRSLIG
jgi:long-chain acyl-CoA synthetase